MHISNIMDQIPEWTSEANRVLSIEDTNASINRLDSDTANSYQKVKILYDNWDPEQLLNPDSPDSDGEY